jgi:lycopene beta-cyclase
VRPPAPPPELGTHARPFDFAIVGAGAAGLSLAVQLSAAFADRTTILIDPGFGDVDDRTFAFWCEGAPPLAEAVEATWRHLRLVAADREVRGTLERYRYHVLSGVGFREACFARLAGDGRTFFRPGHAASLEEADHRVRVRGPDGLEVVARWVFDSRPAEPVPDPARHVMLRQRFLGWEVEAERDAFDPATVTLFDFRTPQGEGDPRFVYVLPFGARRALVEHVATRRGDAREALRRYLEETLGVGPYRVRRAEAGDSPLTDAPFVRRTGPRTLRIGVAGGRLKASSGYAFTRIWDDAAAIVASLRREGHPFDLPPDPTRFRVLDGLLLRVMRDRPARMAEVFLRMFARNPADRVFRLLDEGVGASEILALGLTLPVAPFAEALGEASGRRLHAALAQLVAPIEYDD